MSTQNKIKLVTHDGSFHTDDVFACATLSLYLDKEGKEFEVIRTRDENIINTGDYVFDIGGVYDKENNKFDHHQKGGAGKHQGEGEIDYAAFGLVWDKFGPMLCGSQEESDFLEKKLAFPVDAWDNGISIASNIYKEFSPYLIQNVFFSMEPTWQEDDLNIDDMFLKSVAFAKEILSREIKQIQSFVVAEKEVTNIYNNTEDKRIIVVDKGYPFQYTLNKFPEPLYVVYPRKTNNYWGVQAVRSEIKTFNNRKNLPAAWAGVRDEELVQITGVEDAVFCHRGLYMAVAKTKEGAMKLAQIALES